MPQPRLASLTATSSDAHLYVHGSQANSTVPPPPSSRFNSTPASARRIFDESVTCQHVRGLQPYRRRIHRSRSMKRSSRLAVSRSWAETERQDMGRSRRPVIEIYTGASISIHNKVPQHISYFRIRFHSSDSFARSRAPSHRPLTPTAGGARCFINCTVSPMGQRPAGMPRCLCLIT